MEQAEDLFCQNRPQGAVRKDDWRDNESLAIRVPGKEITATKVSVGGSSEKMILGQARKKGNQRDIQTHLRGPRQLVQVYKRQMKERSNK